MNSAVHAKPQTQQVLYEPIKTKGYQAHLVARRCDRFYISGLEYHEAECGYLHTLENPQAEYSRELKLAIMRLKPKQAATQLPPVVYLAGGPGSEALSAASYLSDLVFFQQRELIIMDQRGTGQSRPQLCPELDTNMVDDLRANQNAETWAKNYLLHTQACIAQLRQQHAELDFYSSAGIVQDHEQLRQVLKIKHWDLYGSSYGSRLALRYLQDTTNSVRVAVLDGPVPIAIAMYELDPGFFFDTLKSLGQVCTEQNMCDHPMQLLELTENIFLRLQQQPLHIVEQPPKQKTMTINSADFVVEQLPKVNAMTINSHNFIDMVYGLLYYHGDYPDLLKLLKQTAAGQSQTLQDMFVADTSSMEDSHAAVFDVIHCREERPFNDDERIRHASQQHPILASFGLVGQPELNVCQYWPVKPIAADRRQPTFSDRPVLILTGQYDHATPPIYGQQLQQQLKHGQWVNMLGIAHGAMANSHCVDNMIARFFSHPQQTVNTDCVDDLSPPEFRTAQQRIAAVSTTIMWSALIAMLLFYIAWWLSGVFKWRGSATN